MTRSKPVRWFDSLFVFVGMGWVLLWQLVTPEYRVRVPVRARSSRLLKKQAQGIDTRSGV
ncbi:MAG TPA: hypothetical protein VGD55_06630 [Acidothermaceae bacterium]